MFTSRKLLSFMAYLEALCWIRIKSFLVTFGGVYSAPSTQLLYSTCHNPQRDGQIKVTNKTLAILLRSLVSKSIEDWDRKLPHAKFAYNRTPSFATAHSPLESCYGSNPIMPLELIPLSLEFRVNYEVEEREKEMKKLHQQIRAKIEKTNDIYKTSNKHHKGPHLQARGLVWLHLRKERYPSRRINKLMSRGHGPFRILEKVNDNAYKLELPGDMGVSLTFNVGDLTLFLKDSDDGDGDDLRGNHNQEGENEEMRCAFNSNRALKSFLVFKIFITWDLVHALV